jgi:hypothetical protein
MRNALMYQWLDENSILGTLKLKKNISSLFSLYENTYFIAITYKTPGEFEI